MKKKIAIAVSIVIVAYLVAEHMGWLKKVETPETTPEVPNSQAKADEIILSQLNLVTLEDVLNFTDPLKNEEEEDRGVIPLQSASDNVKISAFLNYLKMNMRPNDWQKFKGYIADTTESKLNGWYTYFLGSAEFKELNVIVPFEIMAYTGLILMIADSDVGLIPRNIDFVEDYKKMFN